MSPAEAALRTALQDSRRLNGDIQEGHTMDLERRQIVRRQDDVDQITRAALLEREILLQRGELDALERKVESLIAERNNALRYGILALGTAVIALITFIVMSLKGTGHP